MMITSCSQDVTSPDPLVGGVAQYSLECTVHKRFGVTEGHEDQWWFLAGQLKSGQVWWIFTVVRNIAA